MRAPVPTSSAPPPKAPVQPPVAYLPCVLDEEGRPSEIKMLALRDGRVALVGYTALDRLMRGCGDAHPWVLYATQDLASLRERKPYDLALLDVPLPEHMRLEGEAR